MRMIPARTVQGWLDKIVNEAEDNCVCCARKLVIDAAEDMNLLTVNERDEDGNPTDITWLLIN